MKPLTTAQVIEAIRAFVAVEDRSVGDRLLRDVIHDLKSGRIVPKRLGAAHRRAHA